MPPIEELEPRVQAVPVVKKARIQFILLGLLNLAVSVPLGMFGVFGMGFIGDSPNTTDAMIYVTVLILLGLPFYFFLSSMFLFSHFFRKTSNDSVVFLVYVIIPWALLALFSAFFIL